MAISPQPSPQPLISPELARELFEQGHAETYGFTRGRLMVEKQAWVTRDGGKTWSKQ